MSAAGKCSLLIKHEGLPKQCVAASCARLSRLRLFLFIVPVLPAPAAPQPVMMLQSFGAPSVACGRRSLAPFTLNPKLAFSEES